MRIVRGVEAGDDASPGRLEAGDLFRREAKPDELHRRCLAVGAGIFAGWVGSPGDPFAADFEEDMLLDPAEPSQRRRLPRRIADLEHDRGDKLIFLWDHLVIGE